jgi:hypothetical protein
MNKSTRIVDRFEWWSVEDCSCDYCLYVGKDGSCSLDVCCCADIREEAIRREQGATGGSQVRKEAAPCPA